MDTRMGTLNVRPPRLGYLIHRNDTEAVLRILKFSSGIWGGAYHPILALDAPRLTGEAESWLQLYDPDVIVDLYGFDQKAGEECRQKLGLFPDIGWLESLESAARFCVPMSDVVEFAAMSGYQIPQEIFAAGPENETPGSILPVLMLGFDPAAGMPKRIKVNTLSSHNLGLPEFMRSFDREELLSSARAWDLCGTFLNYRAARPSDGHRVFVVLTANEAVEDLALFWNLRIFSAINYRTTRVWIFNGGDFENKNNAESFGKWLLEEFARPAQSRGQSFELTLVSRSLAPKALASISASLRKAVKSEDDNPLVINTLHAMDTENLQGRFLEGIESREPVRTSPLTGFSSLSTSSIREGKMRFAMGRRIVLEIDVEGSPVPKGHFAHSLLCTELPSRVAHSGLAFLIGPDDNVIDFKLPESTQLIQAYLTEKGFETSLSDKGKYGLRLLDKLGGVEELPFLMDETLLSLMITLANEGPKPLGEIAKIVKLKKEDVEPFVKGLIVRGVLRRGLMLPCHACGLRKWYPLNRIDYNDHIHCEDCQIPIEVPITFEFTFRLSGLFSVAVKQGTLTHLFTVFAEQRRHGYEMVFIPGMLIKAMNREIDVVLIDRDGTMMIAECKYDGKSLKVADYDSTVAIAQNIGARIVIFSTLTDFSTAIYKRAETEERVRILLLDREELLNLSPASGGGEAAGCRS